MDEVTATQAASLAGVSERTIRRRIAAGQLPARRVAPNRFAIKVQDLPIHHKFGDFVARLELLEQRVVVLELRQQALLRAVPAVPADSSVPAAEGDPALSQLHALLAELARETERLAPLLGANGATAAAAESGAHSRGSLRSVHRGRGSPRRA